MLTSAFLYPYLYSVKGHIIFSYSLLNNIFVFSPQGKNSRLVSSSLNN